jgi:hypothetical protein
MYFDQKLASFECSVHSRNLVTLPASAHLIFTTDQ